MARTALTVQTVSRSGLDPTYAAVDNANGNYFPNTGKEMLHVFNASGGALTVTVLTPRTVDGLAVAELTVSINNGEDAMIGPFPSATFIQGADRPNVYVDWSTGTSVTAAVIKLENAS